MPNTATTDATAGAADGLRIELLGGFRVCVGSRAVPEAAWRRRTAAALVKLLALAPGHRLHREQVTELLWPDLAPEAAANALYKTLHGARWALAPALPPGPRAAYLRLQGEQVALCPAAPLWIDAEAFAAAAAAARAAEDPAAYQAALGLYTGDLLPEDRYEDWAAGRREVLRGLYLDLLIELGRLHEAREERAPAIAALERVVASEPAHEAAHAGLMRLHALAGARHLALRQYRLLAEALRREIDAEPEATTQRLHRDILAGRFPAGAALPPRHNLPGQLTSFVGREQEVVELTRLLAPAGDADGDGGPPAPRLVTLTGAGGAGKTRLALQAAAGLVEQYPDGVWLVELAPLADPALVPQAVAAALGVREHPGRPLLDGLCERLRSRQALLVLDNCEHLVEACAGLADALLRACPRFQILATSREALGIAGETVWLVPPLPAPDPDRLPAAGADLVAALPRYEAVRLFVERAPAVQRGFALAPENAAAVARLCHRLDGLPLAIELAAARVKALSVEQIAARLDDRFRLLTDGSRAALPRHQTLRNAIAWSYDLLGSAEQALFSRLAVFAGGWMLEAAEAVCADDEGRRTKDESSPAHPIGPSSFVVRREDVLDLLARLVDRSLVVAETGTDGGGRYRLLETLRQYARERLEESGGAEATARRHTAYYLALAEEAAPALMGPRQAEWLARLAAEHDNLRAALGSALARAAPDVAMRLGAALWRFWYIRGYWIQGRRWLEAALASSGPAPRGIRARALSAAAHLTRNHDNALARSFQAGALAIWRELGDQPGIAEALGELGWLASTQGDHGQARVFYEQSLAAYRALGDTWGAANALGGLGVVVLHQGEPARAAALYEEGLALFRSLGDEWRVAAMLLRQAELARYTGDWPRAAALGNESLALSRTLGSTSAMAVSLRVLGDAARHQGDDERALALYEEAIGVFLGSEWSSGAAPLILRLAYLAAARGEAARPARLLGASAALLEAMGNNALLPNDRREFDRAVAVAEARIGAAAFAAVWAEGRALPLEQAIAEALSPEPPAAPQSANVEKTQPARDAAPSTRDEGAAQRAGRARWGRGPAALSAREQEVALLIARGLTNHQIAAQLGMAVRTADTHAGNVLGKLGLASRTQVAAWAVQHRLLPADAG